MNRKSIYILLLLNLTFSCSEEGEIGLNFLEQNSFELSSIDTLTLAVSTVLFDSTTTHNRGNVLVGKHYDAKLGEVIATGYLKASLPTSTILATDGTVNENDIHFDSVRIILDYTGYSIYDTANMQSIGIHLTTEEIELDDDLLLYNTSHFNYEQQALASLSFYPRPLKDDSLAIRLPDAMGQEIFTALQDAEVSDYINDFNGLVLVPSSTDNASILGFSTSSRLRVYYHINSELAVEEHTHDIPLAGTHFSQLLSNRASTDLATLVEQRYDLPSSQSNNEAYIQGGTGLALRVRIPHLTNLREAENLVVSKAYLTFRPTASQESINVGFPTALSMYEVDDRNRIVGYWGDLSTFFSDDELDRDTRYQTDITDFVNKQLSETTVNENALLFETGINGGLLTLNRLYIGDDQAEQKMELLIYYIKVQ